MSGSEIVVLSLVLVTTFSAGMGAGILLCMWMIHRSRRFERSIARRLQRAYQVRPERQNEPGS